MSGEEGFTPLCAWLTARDLQPSQGHRPSPEGRPVQQLPPASRFSLSSSYWPLHPLSASPKGDKATRLRVRALAPAPGDIWTHFSEYCIYYLIYIYSLPTLHHSSSMRHIRYAPLLYTMFQWRNQGFKKLSLELRTTQGVNGGGGFHWSIGA